MPENAEIARLQAENAALRRRIAEQDEDLDRLERLLQTTIDHVDSVIYLRDETGIFTHINNTYEQLTHLSREAVLGRRDSDVFPRSTRPFGSPIGRSSRTSRPSRRTSSCRRRTGCTSFARTSSRCSTPPAG
ncbi:PAS domain-containing protein [Nannocystis pusilla]|uniref:PAS domain-containing protein n=1 Tax=Nannocystis pusilla TaxID=889268 RepID=A0A9X3F0W6_9BACT|nr:PAS domain-containing protein [Nannocystis pusilla]MCY1013987.1 PAS domain-containing protein [Nannocystis pusilla]